MINNAECGQISAIIALDQSAAFDIVPHNILKEKLKLIGFDPEAQAWIASYLKERYQKVDIESFLSSTILQADRNRFSHPALEDGTV